MKGLKMKKFIAVIMLAIMLMSPMAFAGDKIGIGFIYTFQAYTPSDTGALVMRDGKAVSFESVYPDGVTTLDTVLDFISGESSQRYDKKWEKTAKNIMPTAGLNHMANVVFHEEAATTTWYMGLLPNGATLALADTMASKEWTEVVAYDEATRPAWTEGAASGGVITNGTAVDFTISTDSTVIEGGFITSVNTKSGETGILISEAAFSVDQTLNDGDILKVTATVTFANPS
ncbi:MAG: hypothetical protein ABIK15_07375 [Pseudomonadota bacterium]